MSKRLPIHEDPTHPEYEEELKRIQQNHELRERMQRLEKGALDEYRKKQPTTDQGVFI